MAAKTLPEQSVLLQLFHYEPETGKLFWKERSPEWFSTGRYSAERNAGQWNKQYANQEAFHLGQDGYRRGKVLGKYYRAHRIIFKMMTGIDPDDIDHIDGDRANNRWNNLRDVSRSTNQMNKAISKRNTSGVTGISWHKGAGKWRAQIKDNGTLIQIGYFSNLEDAAAARKAAEIEYGFHANHGRQRPTIA